MNVQGVLYGAVYSTFLTQTIKSVIILVMNLIFGLLWQDEVIRENPVARVKVPKVETDRRERAVLTDAELVRYLGWQHPEEHHGMAVLERQTIACISPVAGSSLGWAVNAPGSVPKKSLRPTVSSS